jgi:hypothetical protein
MSFANYPTPVKAWACGIHLAINARQGTGGESDPRHENGPWVVMMQAQDGMTPARSVEIRGRAELQALAAAVAYALSKEPAK